MAVVIWLMCAGLGFLIGKDKGRGAEGFLWGFFLGLIGLLVIIFRSPANVPHNQTRV